MKYSIVSLLICSLIAFAAAQSSIQLDVFSGSNAYWLAVAVRNAGVDTQSVQIQQSQSPTWQSLAFQTGWGFYTVSTGTKLKFPVSVRITAKGGAQVTINNAISSLTAGLVETGVSFDSNAVTSPTTTPDIVTSPTAAATSAPAATSRPATSAPNKGGKATKAATAAPTSRPSKSTTAAPVKSATAAPAKSATAAPVKSATSAANSGSGSSSGCSAEIGLMVPLYTYPGASWDVVAAGGKTVKTVAIINPNSGPGSGPDSTYVTYMNKLNAAGVDIVGYVHTSYGARSIADVKADIDVYASQFPLVKGIFLDEAGNSASVLPYYQELYNYIMGMPGWKYDVINPGSATVAGYVNAATQIVAFEDHYSKFAASANPSGASCTTKDKYSVITYGASATAMQSAVATARSKGYYGWVYVADRTDICCIYNTITPYYAAMVSYIASTN